jgi:fructokinase
MAAPPDLDVLSFGEVIVDFFPERTGVPLVDVDVFRRHLGGAPANVAIGAARQGLRAGLMTLVGPDDFGRFARARLAAEGVDVAALGTHPVAKTGITFVSVAADGARSFLFFRHPSADQCITTDDVDPAQVRRARVFHFGSSTLSREPGRAATLKAFEAAADAGLVISSDPNLRPHLWERPADARDLLVPLLARCDVLKVSDDELGPITGTGDPVDGARTLRRLGAGLVMVTSGPRGLYFDGPGGRGHVDAERVDTVDSTGAGDAFVAGVLASLMPRFAAGQTVADLDERAIRESCAEGAHLGACAVTALGATTAVPRKAPTTS